LRIIKSVLKKVLHAQEQDREDVAQARSKWRTHQSDLPAAQLIFIDETGATTKMSRRYGRCTKSKRLVDKVPHGHWKTTTFMAALRNTGLTAPMILDGPMNGDIFRTWVQQFLLPTLAPGDIVVMDNLPAHKVAGIRQMIETANAKLLYLPPYSPDLNSIELAFSKFKALLRKAAARTLQTLWKTMAHIVDTFSAHECQNYFKAAGYSI
jgi:transposase